MNSHFIDFESSPYHGIVTTNDLQKIICSLEQGILAFAYYGGESHFQGSTEKPQKSFISSMQTNSPQLILTLFSFTLFISLREILG